MDTYLALAIETHQAALLRIVAKLMILAELVDGLIPARLERVLHTTVLRVLRPAEAAARRLIVLMAHGIAVKLRPARPVPAALATYPAGKPRISFQLFDPRKRFRPHAAMQPGPGPRLPLIDTAPGPLVPLYQPAAASPARCPPGDEGMVGALTLGRRLTAIKAALDDLPAQARRMARWQARRKRMTGFVYRSALRPGPPPGHRRKPRDEIDRILRDCHDRAWIVLRADTS